MPLLIFKTFSLTACLVLFHTPPQQFPILLSLHIFLCFITHKAYAGVCMWNVMASSLSLGTRVICGTCGHDSLTGCLVTVFTHEARDAVPPQKPNSPQTRHQDLRKGEKVENKKSTLPLRRFATSGLQSSDSTCEFQHDFVLQRSGKISL